MAPYNRDYYTLPDSQKLETIENTLNRYSDSLRESFNSGKTIFTTQSAIDVVDLLGEIVSILRKVVK